MVCGPRRGGNVTIRSLRLVSALTEIGGRAAPQGAVLGRLTGLVRGVA